MSKFIIQPHGRLQEAVAHEKGYFSDEGLDYEITGGEIAGREKKVDEAGHVVEIKQGAYESYEAGKGNKGRKFRYQLCLPLGGQPSAASDVGKLWGGAYVVTPGGIMVPEDSDIRRPEDLAGKEIAVGYHSGSLSRQFRRWSRSFRVSR